MDFNALVSEIVARVAERMDACDCKPRLLVLTPEHGEICHSFLESSRLKEYYTTECALLSEYKVCPEDYEAIILFGLTNEALCRLAGGVCDTPFTALAQKLILAGKRIFIPECEVELYQYAQSAPPAYYRMMTDRLALLTQSGITICPAESLTDVILSGAPAPKTAPCCTAAPANGEARIEKRVVTEKDMAQFCDRSIGILRIGKKTILTDLARDFAHTRKITVVRDD